MEKVLNNKIITISLVAALVACAAYIVSQSGNTYVAAEDGSAVNPNADQNVVAACGDADVFAGGDDAALAAAYNTDQAECMFVGCGGII
jgi:hypothetical protein